MANFDFCQWKKNKKKKQERIREKEEVRRKEGGSQSGDGREGDETERKQRRLQYGKVKADREQA